MKSPSTLTCIAGFLLLGGVSAYQHELTQRRLGGSGKVLKNNREQIPWWMKLAGSVVKTAEENPKDFKDLVTEVAATCVPAECIPTTKCMMSCGQLCNAPHCSGGVQVGCGCVD